MPLFSSKGKPNRGTSNSSSGGGGGGSAPAGGGSGAGGSSSSASSNSIVGSGIVKAAPLLYSLSWRKARSPSSDNNLGAAEEEESLLPQTSTSTATTTSSTTCRGRLSSGHRSSNNLSSGWEEAEDDEAGIGAGGGAGMGGGGEPEALIIGGGGGGSRPSSLRSRGSIGVEEILDVVGTATTTSTTSNSRPSSLRSRGSILEEALEDDLKGLLSSSSIPTSPPPSPPIMPIDTYLRSVYVNNRGGRGDASDRGPWQTSFLRRNTTKEHLPTNNGASSTSGANSAAGEAPTPPAGTKSTPNGPSMGSGNEMSALARAFEKKRLAIVASLRHRTKLSLVLFCPLIVLIMLFATLVSFSRDSVATNSDALNHVYPDSTLTGPKEKFTVMINTYKRHDMAKDAVKHYANCDRVDAIRVVWSENGSVPQEEKDKEWFSSKKKVYYDQYKTTSLNNRFVPPEGLATDSVFAVDDDIRVPCSDLDFAYEVWKVADGSLVGFMPRIHTLNPAAVSRRASIPAAEAAVAGASAAGGAATAAAAGGLSDASGSATASEGNNIPLFRYNGWWKVWWDGEYSLILTKAAFLHRDFLKAYTEEMPTKIREYVDENRNCEDIAMQFLASNLTGKPPIFVRGHLTDLGVFNGISTKSWTKLSHMKSRGQCLNDFVDLYGGVMPLVKGRIVAGPAASWWFNQPSTVFEYFSSDLLVARGVPSVRRAKAMHLIPLLALMVLVVIKLMYG